MQIYYLCGYMRIKINWDGLGIITSIVCAIHCGVLPFILPALSLFGVNIIHNTMFEWSMIVMAFSVGLYSLYHGFIKHHHSFLPAIYFFAGFSFLVLKQFFLNIESILLLIAVVLIISAHMMNYRLCSKSKCTSPHHKH